MTALSETCLYRGLFWVPATLAEVLSLVGGEPNLMQGGELRFKDLLVSAVDTSLAAIALLLKTDLHP
jgi:hypothetical protein